MKRPRKRWISSAAAGAAAAAALWAGVATTAAETATPQATYGPVLEGFGPVYYMGEVDFATPLDRDFRGLFDVSDAASEPDARSASIETAARFLNMHAQAGVPRERLGAAIVLHGGAARYALNNEAYRERYDVDNPQIRSAKPDLPCRAAARPRRLPVPTFDVGDDSMGAFSGVRARPSASVGRKAAPW